MPTTSAPSVRYARISAGVSKDGPRFERNTPSVRRTPSSSALRCISSRSAGSYASSMLGNRVPMASSLGPISGLRICMLMWSVTSTSSPGPTVSRVEPTADVRKNVSQPSSFSTYVGTRSCCGSTPSYMCTRPWNATTGTPLRLPHTSCPLWPLTVLRGKSGMSSYGITVASSISSATPPSPLPSITPARGWNPSGSTERT
mmetsp:Transcript_153211/g.371955  ORF Transcript_153211/g.371955 Transcript_153211/m.371955 type:complete len:201 (+) Transcript_153211:264-866(+)